jgi:uncharacterized membrane protein YphA (DoxX/SURF4 family)
MTVSALSKLSSWIEEPVLVLRIELFRFFGPLFILGFMSRRFVYADEWIGETGFRVPPLYGDWRQPLYIPALPAWAAWSIAVVMVVAGLSVALGFRTRAAALVFAGTLTFVALSDRLAAFTVSKISPVLMLAVAIGPAGTRLGIDAWRKRRGGGKKPRKRRSLGPVRFLQLFLPAFYSGSGIAKARGDWLTTPHLLWTHLHDTYQTSVSFFIARITPGWGFNILQGLVLLFEAGAPIWFAIRGTRNYAFVFGMGLHLMIAVMFGPVVWFGCLMMSVLAAAYMPESWFEPLERLATWFERRPKSKGTEPVAGEG